MILDLEKFIRTEKPYWQELETHLSKLEIGGSLDMPEVSRFYYLYQRASAGLGKLMTFSAEQEIKVYLEDLVARTYAEIHEVRSRQKTFSLQHWFFTTFPCTFRRHLNAFWLILITTGLGAGFGIMSISIAPDSKAILLPFSHLQNSPEDRVAQEMKDKGKRLEGHQLSFSSQLMTNNIGVSIKALGLGITYGIGTIIIIFYNGVILGAVCWDYILDGQAIFLAGWLLPHGSVEIPAFLLAGQAGLILAGALIGRQNRLRLKDRLRSVLSDLTTMISGISLLLIWAGLIESFFSQYHAPIIPYWLKITFGSIQLLAVIGFLTFSGKKNIINSGHNNLAHLNK